MIELSKYEATGNDFIVVDRRREGSPNEGEGGGAGPAAGLEPALVVALCDRRRGVGADGVITLRDAPGSDCAMVLQNADGGAAEVSGNGLRCAAMAAAGADAGSLAIETGAGRRQVDLRRDASGLVVAAEVDMGPVVFEPADIPVAAATGRDLEVTVDGLAFRGDALGLGNPHFVVFVDDVAGADVATLGPLIEASDLFPRRTNVEFVSVVAPDTVTMRVWERGVGETLSCGSAACAAAAVAHRRDLVGPQVSVEVPGGRLSVSLGTTTRLGGPVSHVFDARVDDAVIGAGRHRA